MIDYLKQVIGDAQNQPNYIQYLSIKLLAEMLKQNSCPKELYLRMIKGLDQLCVQVIDSLQRQGLSALLNLVSKVIQFEPSLSVYQSFLHSDNVQQLLCQLPGLIEHANTDL